METPGHFLVLLQRSHSWILAACGWTLQNFQWRYQQAMGIRRKVWQWQMRNSFWHGHTTFCLQCRINTDKGIQSCLQLFCWEGQGLQLRSQSVHKSDVRELIKCGMNVKTLIVYLHSPVHCSAWLVLPTSAQWLTQYRRFKAAAVGWAQQERSELL